jgi:intermediate peptidase
VKITKEDLEGSRKVYDHKRTYRLIALANGVTNSVWVGAWSKEARSLLKNSIKEETRKKIYTAQFSSKSPKPLEKLLRARAQLAQLVGFPSYAHMLLKHKMSKSPGG